MSQNNKTEFNFHEWTKKCIEGPQGLLALDHSEFVHKAERLEISVANWIIRCLANPECEGSDKVVAAIIERRKKRENVEDDNQLSLFIDQHAFKVPTYVMGD